MELSSPKFKKQNIKKKYFKRELAKPEKQIFLLFF